MMLLSLWLKDPRRMLFDPKAGYPDCCISPFLKHSSNLLYRSGTLFATTAQSLAKLHVFASHLYDVALDGIECILRCYPYNI